MAYRARWLRFLANHALEVREDGAIPSHLYTEFEHLGPGRICSCHTVQLAAETIHQSGVFESRMPGATWLDFQVAYDSLPMNSHGRTEVWLLMHGTSEQERYDMSPSLFLAHHRNRIRAEISRPGHKKSPATTEVARGDSVWELMASFLNGEQSEHPAPRG